MIEFLVLVGVAASTVSAWLGRDRIRAWSCWLGHKMFIAPMESALERRIAEQVTPMREDLARQLGPIANRVEAVYYEMHPNGGTALRDVVDRTERKVEVIGERVARVEGQVDVLTKR